MNKVMCDQAVMRAIKHMHALLQRLTFFLDLVDYLMTLPVSG